jgi:hypothetical protein
MFDGLYMRCAQSVAGIAIARDDPDEPAQINSCLTSIKPTICAITNKEAAAPSSAV